jgi:GcrA cell cycle regulator
MKSFGGLVFRPRPAQASLWTDERIGLLKARWSQGASARQISGELGFGISRDSVLGKVRRLGIFDLSPRGGRRVERSVPKETPPKSRYLAINTPTVIYLPRQHTPPDWVVNAIPYVDDPLVDADIPLRQRRSFVRLNQHTCRWPVGDPSRPDFFVCGAEPRKDEPYCAEHGVRACRPAKQAAQRRTMLESRGIDTYIKLGGETAVDVELEEESR